MHLKPTADNTIVLKSPREIAIMREAGQIVAQTIRALEEQAQPGMTTRDLDQIAASTVKGWMESAGHRQNILQNNYSRTGIGAAIAGNGQVFITQVFCG